MAISGFGKAEKGFVLATLGELMAMRHHHTKFLSSGWTVFAPNSADDTAEVED